MLVLLHVGGVVWNDVHRRDRGGWDRALQVVGLRANVQLLDADVELVDTREEASIFFGCLQGLRSIC